MICILNPIMVKVKVLPLQRAMKQAGLSEYGLADAMEVSHGTIKNIMAGKPINSGTQSALHKALGDYSPGVKLFAVVLDDPEV